MTYTRDETDSRDADEGLASVRTQWQHSADMDSSDNNDDSDDGNSSDTRDREVGPREGQSKRMQGRL